MRGLFFVAVVQFIVALVAGANIGKVDYINFKMTDAWLLIIIFVRVVVLVDAPISTGPFLGNNSTDPNWTASFQGAASTSTVVVTNNQWYKEFSTFSSWISPPADQWGCNQIGDFTFTTQFNLVKYDYTKYTLTAEVASDDALKAVYVNGVQAPVVTPCATDGNYATCIVTYKLSGHFKSGLNTVAFKVNNAAGPEVNPVGLNVNFII